MKVKLTLSLLALSGMAMLPALGLARNSQDDPNGKSASVRTISGCLSAGDSSHEYNLTTEDGNTWEITSKTVKLSDHVGHTVKVTGDVWHPDMHGAKEKTKEAVDPNAKEHGHLRVTELDMISGSCKR